MIDDDFDYELDYSLYGPYDEPDAADLDYDLPERDEDNACPECDTGVVLAGVQEYDTGHIPHYCSECGWEA